MNISIVSGVFPPEPIMSARTSSDLACELASKGHSVVVITSFPNRPAGQLYEGYHRKLWVRENPADGFEILRIFSFFSSQSGIFSRFLENLSFGIGSALAVLFLEKPDVIYANTWPLFAQALLVLTCKLRQIPLVLSIQDLYPESLFVQKRGFEKNSRLYRSLRWLDAQIARNCTSLIVISEQFKETYIHDRGIPENKVSVIPNWIDDTQSIAVSDGMDIRTKHNIPGDAFLVVYGGNIGMAAGVEHLIDAFKCLIPQEKIYLLIAGAGSNLPDCLERIQKHNLERVKIHSPWQTKDTLPVLGAADLCVLPTKGEQSLASVPSKLLTYMLAGRCVLAIASQESETARMITDSQAGWVISGGDPDTVGDRISEISRLSSNDLDRRGQAARSFGLKHFSKSENLSKVLELLFQHRKSSEQDSAYATS